MVKLLATSYLALLLASCATDRVANANPMDDCRKTYTKFQEERDAFNICKEEDRCSWSYSDVRAYNTTQLELFQCYKEKNLPNE